MSEVLIKAFDSSGEAEKILSSLKNREAYASSKARLEVGEVNDFEGFLNAIEPEDRAPIIVSTLFSKVAAHSEPDPFLLQEALFAAFGKTGAVVQNGWIRLWEDQISFRAGDEIVFIDQVGVRYNFEIEKPDFDQKPPRVGIRFEDGSASVKIILPQTTSDGKNFSQMFADNPIRFVGTGGLVFGITFEAFIYKQERFKFKIWGWVRHEQAQ